MFPGMVTLFTPGVWHTDGEGSSFLVLDVPAHANKELMTTLRDAYGFGNGVALSDCNDIGAIESFRFATNRR